MPRHDRAYGVHHAKSQKAGNGRRKASRRKASGTRKLADKGK
jgi:hypothetical protein